MADAGAEEDLELELLEDPVADGADFGSELPPSELLTGVSESLAAVSLSDDLASESFGGFLPPSRKSVTYQPEPFKIKDVCDIILVRGPC